MPKVGNKHYPYTPEGRAAAARDRQGRGLTATEGFNQPRQLDDAAGRAMYEKGGKVKGFKEGKEVKDESRGKLRRAVFGSLFEKKNKKSRKTAGMKKGGPVVGNKSSGRSKASKRADGIARQGHTKGRVV